MRFIQPVGFALFFAGCAAALGQTDDFPDKLGRGCTTVDQCTLLVGEARGRVQRCQENTVGYIRCGDARADLTQAETLLELAKRHAQEAERATTERQAAQAQSEADEDAKMKAFERRKAEDAAWSGIRLQPCADQSDPAACDLVRQFLIDFPDGRHAGDARHALDEAHEIVLAKSRAEAEERARVDEENRLREEAKAQDEERKHEQARRAERGSAPASQRPERSPAPRIESTGYVMCCDGSPSPSCTCGRSSYRGCCSHHGGICGGC